MLFNSYIFVFAFLPIALCGFHILGLFGRRLPAIWLVLTSVLFYGWWNPQFVVLLLASVGLNYLASVVINATERQPTVQTACLTAAIVADVFVLIYYKYLTSIIQVAIGMGLIADTTANIVLPLGISFFTFTQIGYLIDTKQGITKDRRLLNYVLFVTFFPHLIAGPILHNQEIMPQFGEPATYRFSGENLSVGLSIFVIGLVKKCLFADTIGTGVSQGFGAADHLPLLAAWNVALCYSLQLYFDFSGYSDMAIGLARMFNVRFPLNFNSPYKSASIIEHWQRWHMTLSRYLALYLYNPIALAVTRWRANRGLGINRTAQTKPGGFAAMVMFPVVTTMALAGIWHGAGLNFLAFGLLHGIYLTINHAFRIFRPSSSKTRPSGRLGHGAKILITYLATLVALVFFRASSVRSALSLLGGMIGLHGVDALAIPNVILAHLGVPGDALVAKGLVVDVSLVDFATSTSHLVWMVGLYIVVWCLPNTQQIMRRFTPALGMIQRGPFERFVWQPTRGWAVAIGVAACIGVLAIGGTSEFLYFQF
ncbi:MBOAT family protein [Acidisphaera sp. S103]|uniref:MBOAT family O-acyltransferase n=1 Tax=Acidisphaera sp. S103 TaxID=1747223 RepID=UPI00131EB8D8|nr:MBOAT family O-acyltransferase [Acidisphaera sp. S103]